MHFGQKYNICISPVGDLKKNIPVALTGRNAKKNNRRYYIGEILRQWCESSEFSSTNFLIPYIKKQIASLVIAVIWIVLLIVLVGYVAEDVIGAESLG